MFTDTLTQAEASRYDTIEGVTPRSTYVCRFCGTVNRTDEDCNCTPVGSERRGRPMVDCE